LYQLLFFSSAVSATTTTAAGDGVSVHHLSALFSVLGFGVFV
jgi:hypothetical protein